MLIVSDVHAEFEGLRRVAGRGEPVLVLGDVINFIDYRTCEGILSEVLGLQAVRDIVELRGRGDWEGSRALWERVTAGRRSEVRASIEERVGLQYDDLSRSLEGAAAHVTFGNVDWPHLLRESLPQGSTFVHGDVVEIEGWKVGFVGGGAPSPLGVPGEVPDAEMERILNGLGDVDVLCTHMAPAVFPLHYDVVAGRAQRSSEPILRYVMERQPAFHYFGDIHQPMASRWRVGRTKCLNVGYFRATRRPLRHPPR